MEDPAGSGDGNDGRDDGDEALLSDRVSHSMIQARRRLDRVLDDNPRMAGFVHGARQATRDAGVHRLTTVMIAASLLVLFGVPHIRALLVPPSRAFDLSIYLVSMLCALLFYPLAWFGTMPVDAIRRADRELLGAEKGWYAWLYARAQWAGRLLDGLLSRARGSRAITGSLLLGALALLTLRSDSPPVIVNVLALCAWLLLQSFDVRWPFGDAEARRAGAALVGRTVTMLLVANLGVELVWWIQGLLGEHEGTYSIWAVFQTLFAVTLVVRMLDVLGLLELLGTPVLRFAWALAAVAFFAFFPGGTRVGEAVAKQEAAGAAAVGALLSPTGRAHADAQPRDHAWLEALDARLQAMPPGQPAILVAASGGGSRAAITASLVFELLDHTPRPAFLADEGSLADNVLLVSSVSGGSLATAYFYTHGPDPEAATLRETAFVRAMGRDYMAPLLRGVLHVTQERGNAVASFWRDSYGWHDVFDDSAHAGDRPLVVLNGTDVKLGTRVAFGFPALPAGLLVPARVAADIGDGLRLNLADAVRISANFPYGFDHVVFGPDSHELIDGGVVDNTGLDTLVLLLEGLQRMSASPEGPSELAIDVFQQLEARGLIVLEIDAGARPGEPSFMARQFPSLSKPLEALGRSAHHNSTVLRRGNLERLQEVLEPTAVGLVRAGFDCDPAGDVMTAWALDAADRERIAGHFDEEVDGFVRDQLELQIEAIACMQAQQRLLDQAQATDQAPDPLLLKANRRLVGSYQEFQARAREHAAQHHLCAQRVAASVRADVTDAAKLLREALDRSLVACGTDAAPPRPFVPADAQAAAEEPPADDASSGDAADAAAEPSAAAAVKATTKPGTPSAAKDGIAKAEPTVPKSAPTKVGSTKAGSTKAGSKSGGSTLDASSKLAALDRRTLEAMLSSKSSGATPKLDRSASLQGTRIPKELLASKAGSATRTRVLGWVYLGALDGKRWDTRYARWGDDAVPTAGERIVLTGTSHVRTAVPDERGALSPSRMTLPIKTELIVLATEDWGDAGFIWARVATQD